MVTDASNSKRDALNAMAQERRAQAGELGTHRVQLPGKPYNLASGDQVIFTAQYRIPGAPRVENGITGTILDTSRHEDKVTIQTREPESRDIEVDTSKFSDLSLGYATHIRKGQGLTTETSQVLAGGWQTDKENIYVSVTRAREQTDIHITRDDLGEQGLDTHAIQRLADRMQRSRAQQASITKQTSEQTPERSTETVRSRRQTIDEAPEQPGQRQPDWDQRIDQHKHTDRDPHIEQAIQRARERQESWERDIDPDRDNDRRLAIE